MLFLFCISIIIGAIGYRVFEFSIFELLLLGALWGALFVLLFRSKKSFVLGLALMMSVVLGGLRFWMIPQYEIPFGNQALVGTVRRIDERLDNTRIVVVPDGYNTKIQVTTTTTAIILPGDRISFRGVVRLPEDFTTDTGRVFDYDGYLESRGVRALMSRAQILVLDEAPSKMMMIARVSTQLRQWIAEILARYVVFPVDGVIGGMLVGFQGGIPASLSDTFRTTGTLHILVLSGYNITVLAGFLGLLLRRIPFKLKTIGIFSGIVVLVLVSGAGVAAVRAGIMGSIALLAGATLSAYNVFRALLIAFLFFFFANPVTIFVDPGFHLSFLATFFIIALLPRLKEKMSWIPEWRWNIKETVLLAVGLPLWMLPYLMYFSGTFPFVSPLANIIMVPLIPLLMISGLATIVVSFVPFLAGIVGGVASGIGMLTIALLTFLSRIPVWNTPMLLGGAVLVCYGVILGIVFRKELKQAFLQYKKVIS